MPLTTPSPLLTNTFAQTFSLRSATFPLQSDGGPYIFRHGCSGSLPPSPTFDRNLESSQVSPGLSMSALAFRSLLKAASRFESSN